MNWQQAIIARPSVKRLGMLAFSLLALLATALPASAGQALRACQKRRANI